MFNEISNNCTSLSASVVPQPRRRVIDMVVIDLIAARGEVQEQMRKAGNMTPDQLRDFVADIEKIEGRMSL